MRRATPCCAFVAAAGLVAACVGEGTDDGDALHVDSLPRLTLVEELRIGSVDDPDEGFTRIGGTIHVEPEGVWVAESSDRQIRLYDPSGALVRTIGREGDGPGEFRSVSTFGFVGDTLWVRDGSARRVTLFTRDGELVGTVSGSIEIPYTDTNGFARTVTVYPAALRPDGLFESTANVVMYANLPDSMIMLPTVLFDATGAVVDTLEVVPTRISRSTRVVERSRGRTYITIESPPPDSVERTVEIGGNTVAVGWHVPSGPEDATFYVVRRRGSDALYHHRFRYDPRPVTEAYLDSLAAERARGYGDPSDSARIHRAVREEMRRPPFHDPVAFTRAGEGGGFWIALSDADASSDPWLVIAPDGSVRGMVTLPAMTTTFLRRTEGDTVWVAEIDDLGVPWLVRYRLAGGQP